MAAPLSELLDKLPHRPPFRFLTSVSALDPEAQGEGVWVVDGSEPFLAGHFPGRPMVPGLLIAEALAQLSGIVGFASHGLGEAKLAHVDVRFKESVVPPAKILLRSRLVLVNGTLRQFEVEAQVAMQIVARGRLVLAGNQPGTPFRSDTREVT